MRLKKPQQTGNLVMDDLKKHLQIIIQRLDIHEKMLNNLSGRIERHDEMFNKVIRFMQLLPDYIDEKAAVMTNDEIEDDERAQ